MNDTLDLSLERLDNLEAPMTTGEGIGMAIGLGLIGLGVGILIT